MLAGFGYYFRIWESSPDDKILKVGFLYENDDATPYAFNFTLAQKAMEKEFGDRVAVYSRTNVREDQTAEPLRELIRYGCRIIFCNTNSSQVHEIAAEYPFSSARYLHSTGTDSSRFRPTFIRSTPRHSSAAMSAGSWRG